MSFDCLVFEHQNGPLVLNLWEQCTLHVARWYVHGHENMYIDVRTQNTFLI
jgi:hypothetical protein